MRHFTKLGLVLFMLVLFFSVSQVAYADEVKGKIFSVSPDSYEFVVQVRNNDNITFRMDEDAQVYINDVESTLGDLQNGDRVTVTCRQDGELWFAIEVRCTR